MAGTDAQRNQEPGTATDGLGSGGWDRISQAGYGRAGADLRQLYAKISGTAADMVDGKISMAQAQARANEYAGHARSHFYSGGA